jgi:hypothetical protein
MWKDHHIRCNVKKREVFIPFYWQKSELISIDCDQTESADWQRDLLHNNIGRCNSLSTNWRLSVTVWVVFSDLRFTSSRSHAELDSNITYIYISMYIYIWLIIAHLTSITSFLFFIVQSSSSSIHIQWQRQLYIHRERKKKRESENTYWQFFFVIVIIK